MAKTNDIIQAKEHLYMTDNRKTAQENTSPPTEAEKSTKKEDKFKEVICPNVPTSYFKRAKKQKIKY
ncbi:DEAD/DEAH box helicase [Providencia rettgeri]|uniref:DEAD/DEAH box helicase n=1 Tax=Providencia sp. TaxID=589 RepID=UPI0024AB3A9A|nr:DEAD/DEAH box helicase [Providencia rettgeri]